MDREKLLRTIQILSFLLLDVGLFLDTHPRDAAALKFYDKYRALLMQAEQEYISTYGPLTPGTVYTEYGWTWIEHPWPWEMEA